MHQSIHAASTRPTSPPGAFTVLRVEGIATKRMKWRSRELVIQQAPNLARGTYRVEVAGSVDELMAHIERLSTSEVLVWGLPPHPAGDFVTKSELASLNGSAPNSTIARTRDHFAWAPAMGWAMLDFDSVPPGATLDSLRDTLLDAAKALAEVPMLGMSSASANVYLAGNAAPLRGLSGARLYFPVSDARWISELGARLIDRLILAGHGRAEISKTGQVLLRTPLDGAVWQPERVDFAAGAAMEPPLEQRREMRTWNASSSTLLDDTLLPALTDEERSRLAAVKAELRQAAQVEAKRARAAYRADRAAAGHVASWTDDGDRIVLDGAHEIVLTSGESVTVDTILADPVRYHRASCADPLEPDYHGDDRIAVIKTDGVANIFSHAHGGQLYLLQPSSEARQQAAQEAFPALPSSAGAGPLPTEGERIAALTGDADAAFLAEAMSLRGDLWERWAQLEAAAATRDPLADVFSAVFAAARSAPADRPAAFRFAVRAAMAGDAEWAELTLDHQELLLKAAHSLLREEVRERRTPRLVTAGEPQDYLIERILPRGSLVGLVGLPGQGKSWLGLEMAARIGSDAAGAFGSLAVNARGPVWYLLSEDAEGFRARKGRWELVNGAAPDLHLFDDVPLLTAPIADLLHFVRAARSQAGADPVLVVIDVFADTLVGEDENQAATMVPALRRARIIGRLLGATVLVVHHSPKDKPESARGSVAFLGALDVMNAVVQDDRGTIHFRPVKYRSSPLREEVRFHIADGVLCAGPATSKSAEAFTLETYTEEAGALAVGRAIREIAMKGGVTGRALADEVSESHPQWFGDGVNAKTVSSRLSRAKKRASDQGWLAEYRGRYVPGPQEPPAEMAARPADLSGVLSE